MGLGCALARSGTARSQAALRDAARARAQLRRVVCRFHWRYQSLRRGRPACHGRLRLAAVREERLEGRADAARLAASTAHSLSREDRRDAAQISSLSRGTRLQAVEVLQRSRALDTAAAGVRPAGVSELNFQRPIPNCQPLPISNSQLPTTFNLGVGSWEWLGVGSWELGVNQNRSLE